MDHRQARWRKSSHSGETDCVEVLVDARSVRVRDSADPGGPELSFTCLDWKVFVSSLGGRRSPLGVRGSSLGVRR
jgi:hypothetical protein